MVDLTGRFVGKPVRWSSFQVAGAFDVRLAVGGDIPRAELIIAQVVVLNGSVSAIVDPYCYVTILVDAVAA